MDFYDEALLLVMKPKEQICCTQMPMFASVISGIHCVVSCNKYLAHLYTTVQHLLHIYIYIYMRMYTHTHTHTYIYVLLAVVMHCEAIPQCRMMKPAQMKAA